MKTKASRDGSPADEKLHQRFLKDLAIMHDAEKKLAKAIPLLAAAADSRPLKTVLRLHQKETKGHVENIELAANALQAELPGGTSHEINRLIRHSVAVTARHLTSSNLDSELIGAVRQVEHFEIESYTRLCELADQLGYTSARKHLRTTLDQEEIADEALSRLAAGETSVPQIVKRISLKRIKQPTRGR
jgi:ferritin-like metal-binding protein YciE